MPSFTRGQSLRNSLAAMVFLFAAPLVSTAQLSPALAPGDRVPALQGALHPSAEPVNVDWGHNRLTLVNFWATWCQPCLDEMPKLQELWARHGDEGLLVLGAIDERIASTRLQGYLKRVGAEYPILHVEPSVRTRWGGIAALPTSFLVASDGTVVRRYVGATPGSIEGMIADVDAYLEGKPLGTLVVPEPEPEPEPEPAKLEEAVAPPPAPTGANSEPN